MARAAVRIDDMAPEERPRERLFQKGPQALSDAELIAVLVRTGRPGASALDLAQSILADAGGLSGLAAARATSASRAGLGEAKLSAVLAAVELGRRFAREQMLDRLPLTQPREVAGYLTIRHYPLDQEVMGALFLDGKRRLIAERELFRGTMDRVAVEPRAVLKEALLRDAAAILVFHTHPSGDLVPSSEDLLFTRRLAEACGTLGVRLLDHLILGGVGRWLSLKERSAF